jgi:prepilin-type N-terminal cleavage/methylation domain-containing protein/prepilin-type processing-associated H-X9-DG protein
MAFHSTIKAGYHRKMFIQKPPPNIKRAFTLWELLCVLAIIAFLVALLLPALSRSKDLASRAVCLSYMAGWGTVSYVYLNDSDGLFPAPEQWLYTKESISEEHPAGCRWHDRAMAFDGEIMDYSKEYRGQMWEYISEKSYGIYLCPEFRDYAKSRGCENPDHNQELDIRPQYNYTMNGHLGSQQEGGVLRESEVRSKANVFFFSEENCWSTRPDHPKYPAEWLTAPLSTKALDDTALLINPTPEAKDCFGTIHRAPSKDISHGSGNVVFIDGHVEMVSVEDQLRKVMHGGKSKFGPAGNLHLAWPIEAPPPGGWEAQ